MKEKIKKIILCIGITMLLSFTNINTIKAFESINIKTNNTIKEISEMAIPNMLADSQKLICDQTISDLINEYWGYVMLFTPILLLVMVTLDFFKALFSSDADLMKKASDAAVKRVLAALLLITLPLVLSTLLGFFGLELCI